jgi:hypothetical protein
MSSASNVRGYTLFGVVGGAALGVMLVLPPQSEQVVGLADAPVNSVAPGPASTALDEGVDWQHMVRDELAAGASVANYDRW